MPTKMPRWLWPRHWAKKEVLTCWIFDDFWEVFVKNETFIRIFVSKSWKLAGVTMVWGRIVLVWPNLHPFVGSDHRNRKRSTQGDCRGPWVPKPLTDVTPHFPSYLCVCWERMKAVITHTSWSAAWNLQLRSPSVSRYLDSPRRRQKKVRGTLGNWASSFKYLSAGYILHHFTSNTCDEKKFHDHYCWPNWEWFNSWVVKQDIICFYQISGSFLKYCSWNRYHMNPRGATGHDPPAWRENDT